MSAPGGTPRRTGAGILLASCALACAAACNPTVTQSGDFGGAHDLSRTDFAAMQVDLALLDFASLLDGGVDLSAIPDLATPPPDFAGADFACTGAGQCTTPPAPDCADANTARTYSAPGTCGGSGCMYPSSTMSCTNGCYQGACSTFFLGNSDAFITGTATHVALFGGSAQAGTSVSAITQTFPMGTSMIPHIYYSLNDRNFGAPVDLPMIYDHAAGSNDQWYAILPAQTSGTHVYWYLVAVPNSGVPALDPHGAPTANVLDYTSN
jgi:hypothetical protein